MTEPRGDRAIDAGRYRRIKRVKAAVEAIGVARLPGYTRLIDWFRRRRYPELVAPESLEIEVDGMRLEVPVRFAPHHLQSEYEPLTTAAFRLALAPGGTAVDVGAHIGYYTCLAASAVGSAGHVHAVEPGPDNLRLLRRNVELNHADNVVIHPFAAAADRAVRILRLGDSSDSHSIHAHPLARTVGEIEVEVRPLDAELTPPIDLLKLDVEGAEFEALLGAGELLAGSPGATVIVEWNPKCLEAAGNDPALLPKAMADLGLVDFVVLDEHAGSTRRLDLVLEQVEKGQVPDDWCVNLVASVRA